MGKSILQEWVTNLGLRHQGVLLTAIRVCDTWSKYSTEKPLIREIRGLVLVPFDERELLYQRGFMTGFKGFVHADGPDKRPAEVAFGELLASIDGLPVHYIMHLMHAMEIIGYCHPKDQVRDEYQRRYRRMTEKFHLNPETKEQMDARLGEDRIEKGTVEQ